MARFARVEVFALDEIANVHVTNRTVRRCFLVAMRGDAHKLLLPHKVGGQPKLELCVSPSSIYGVCGDTDHRLSFQRKVAASMTFLKIGLCP